MGKKWLCMALSLYLLMIPVFAAEHLLLSENAQQRVYELQIVEGDEDGSLRLEQFITRAEFVVLAMRLKFYGTVEFPPQDTEFSDVTAAHWAGGMISAAHKIGLVSGDTDGTFRPDAYVTYDEAVKMLVSVAGYDVAAQQAGGYPGGYWAIGAKLGIVQQTTRHVQPLTRAEVCTLIDNTLDVVPLEMCTGASAFERNREDLTLYELFLRERELEEFQGVVQETETVSILSDTISVPKGTVQIGGRIYTCGEDISALLGCYVKGYARQETASGRPQMISVNPVASKNQSWEAQADNVMVYENYLTVVSEDTPSRSPKKYRFSADMICVYNGRKTENIKRIHDGYYRAVDNDGNGSLDILFIEEAESFIAARINADIHMVYFLNRQTFRGKNSLEFKQDDADYSYTIADADGQALAYADIPAGSGLTVMASENKQYMKVLVSDKTVEGRVTMVTQDSICVDGKEYALAVTPQGEWCLKQYLEENQKLLDAQGAFVLDTQGRIIGMRVTAEPADEIFGYVVQAAEQGGLTNLLKLRLLQGAQPQKEVKTVSGNETIYYNFQNEKMKEYCCTPKVKINGVAADSNAAQEIAGCVVRLKLTADGDVREITTYDVPSVLEKHDFNGKILSFGGFGLERGYATDQNTMFICIPKFADEDEDYYMRVQLADQSTSNEVFGVNAYHSVYGGDITDAEQQRRQEAEPVEVLLISAYMDASQTAIVPDTADICIVGRVVGRLSEWKEEADAVIYGVELLNGTKKACVNTKSYGTAFELVGRNLKKGDLIRYTTDGSGRIEKLDILASVQGLDDYGVKEKGYYGVVSDLQQNFYDFQTNEMIDEIWVYLGEQQQERLIRLRKEDGQPVYLYDRRRGGISAASTDDILTLKQAGISEATKVFVLTKDNDAQAIVLIQD